ncbi:MAG: dipeptidase [Syntrophomonadaceae bacterium]|nr:dipeptidase [Syntrophomonadaceae bacterium]
MNIVDLHCDTISRLCNTGESLWENTGHFDIKRAVKSNMAVQFFSLFAMPSDWNTALRQILKQLDRFYQEFELNSDYLYLLKKYSDIEKSENKKKIGCVLHLEGAEALGTDMEILRLLHLLGLRSLGLTWNARNQFADGVGEGDEAGGLSLKGREILQEMSRMKIMLDLSHISRKAFFEALEHYDKPVIASHSNARTVCDHRRNLDDTQLRALAAHGGVIGVNQVSYFISENEGTLDDIVRHIAYIADLIGIEHVALGSDFDGAESTIMKGVEDYLVWEELLERKGFSRQEIEMVLGGNAFRVMEAVLR